MNKQNVVSETVSQGDSDKKKPLTVGEVEVLLKRDLSACLLMLQAVHDDVDVLRGLANFIHGKYLNQLHQKELELQEELKL